MKISAQAHYEGSISATREALLSKELAAKRAAALHVGAPEFIDRTTPGSDEVKREIRIMLPSSTLPPKVSKFLAKGLSATIYLAGRGDQVLHSVDVAAMPVSLELAITLRPDPSNPEHTIGDFAGNLEVRVPFIGSKIEKEAAEQVEKFVARDTAVVNSLLA